MNQKPLPTAAFTDLVRTALIQLKHELQRDYEQAYPALREIIHLVLDEEETNAWNLSPFPHLLFPDLVETHIARLNLRPIEGHHPTYAERRDLAEFPMFQPAFA